MSKILEYNKNFKRFSEEDVSRLVELECRPEKASEYSSRFSGPEVVRLVELKCNPTSANTHNFGRFTTKDIVKFVENDVFSYHANNYEKCFSVPNIIELSALGCEPRIANKYCTGQYSGNEITKLIRLGCPLEKVKEYEPKLNGHIIAILHAIGLPPQALSEINEKRRGRIYELLEDMLRFSDSFSNYSFIGVGSQGIVLLKEDSAWKFSKNIEHEAQLLRRLKNPKHVVRAKGEVKEGIALELEFIKGKTLDEVMRTENYHHRFDIMLKWQIEILNGLIEMHEAGIYRHRDIRPGNILIDRGEEQERAVIIDLGLATTEKNAFPAGNRMFGGPTDLVSLGQILYYDMTGKHLFNGSGSMHKSLSSMADYLNDQRTEAFLDASGELLDETLSLIDETIDGELSKLIIKSFLILKDEKEQFEKIREELTKYYDSIQNYFGLRNALDSLERIFLEPAQKRTVLEATEKIKRVKKQFKENFGEAFFG